MAPPTWPAANKKKKRRNGGREGKREGREKKREELKARQKLSWPLSRTRTEFSPASFR